MYRKLRRKIYKRIRYKTWYRKASYYRRKKRKLPEIMARFRTPEQLADRRYVRRLRRDMVRCLFRYGAYYNEYFLFGFEGRGSAYRAGFITEGIRMRYYPQMNNPKNTDLIENKYRAYKRFRELYKREMLYFPKGKDISPEKAARFRAFAAAHPDYIVKPVYAAFGKGVHREALADYPSPEAALERYRADGAVLEERIEQAPELAALHPQSVNTLRIPTVIIRGANGAPEVRLFHPTLRVGQGDSGVDNFSAGGITALIDPDSGVVYTDGADKKGHRFAVHPDSGVRFQGFQIPRWDEAVAMVRQAARTLPDNHYCGWDLALSARRGWCMVEANSTAQMGGMQIVTQTGRRAELEALIAQM